jgi:hypothetical protein
MDPIDFDGGDVNILRYVGNSPLDWVDPSGLDDCPNNNIANIFVKVGDTEEDIGTLIAFVGLMTRSPRIGAVGVITAGVGAGSKIIGHAFGGH